MVGMKKSMILVFFLFFVTLAVYAQGFYFDIGLGLGKGWTKIDGNDVMDLSTDLSEMAVDIGLKAGYGPLGTIPLYIVGELGGIGHRIYDSYNYMQFNSYIIGPGVLFYPIPLIQFGLSIGYSYIANVTDIPGIIFYNSKSGFAWNISAAVDLGKNNHGCLIGIKYFNANNTLETSNVVENASMVGIFVKYTYRHKATSLF
jgi:hypothetical protein